MQAFLANLTAAVLFIHAAIGCGWHHAHCENPAVPAFEACCDHHHHHHGDEDVPSQKPSPGPCCTHCEVSCVYTVPQKVQVDAQVAISWIDLVTALPGVTTSQTAVPGWIATAEDERATAPPLRLHLLHQLLTI